VIELAQDVLEVAEVERHVDLVAREFLGRDDDRALPGVAVDEAALAWIADLAVPGVEAGVDGDLFHDAVSR